MMTVKDVVKNIGATLLFGSALTFSIISVLFDRLSSLFITGCLSINRKEEIAILGNRTNWFTDWFSAFFIAVLINDYLAFLLRFKKVRSFVISIMGESRVDWEEPQKESDSKKAELTNRDDEFE